MSEWMPIETAPRDGSWFIAWGDHAGMVDFVHWIDYEQFWYDRARMSRSISHWMPLPEPPEDVDASS